MERKLAELVVENFERQGGLKLSVLEVMSMTKIKTDGYDVYALQKGEVIYLAKVYTANMTYSLRTKTVSW